MYNPIILGIGATVLVYLYLLWKVDKDHKKDPSVPKKQASLIIPAIIGSFVWFFAGCYIDNQDTSSDSISVSEGSIVDSSTNQPTINNKSESYHLIRKKTVKLPTTDVFIDLAKF